MMSVSSVSLERSSNVRADSAVADQRPTVCQVLHSLCMGGAEVLAARLARNMRSEFRFVFACLDEAGFLAEELARDGFPVHVFQRRSGFDRRLVRQLRRLFRDEQVDLVHAHQYTPFLYSSLARGWISPRPLLFTEHGRHQPDFPRPKRIWANKLLLRPKDRVVAVGEAVRQALIANEGLPPKRVAVVYNGVDLTRFDPRAPLREVVRRELGLAEAEFAVFQVARLDYLKDHGTALRMMAQLEAGERVRLVLIGDGPERGEIESLRNELHLHGRVTLVGLRTDVPRLLQAADAVLLTSLSEGIPLTLIEAMGAALPVLATRVGGVEEVVIDETTGLLATAKHPVELVAQLRRLSSDRRWSRELGANGRQRAESLFGEPEMHHQYREVYRSQIGTRVRGLEG
jgi:glycosyltransferase involved in cell wall biosynthesis